jgi:hypothetical protein
MRIHDLVKLGREGRIHYDSTWGIGRITNHTEKYWLGWFIRTEAGGKELVKWGDGEWFMSSLEILSINNRDDFEIDTTLLAV